MDKIEKTGGSTVEIRLKQRFGHLVTTLAVPIQAAVILPKSVVDAVGTDDIEDDHQIIGAGPFKLAEWQRGHLRIADRGVPKAGRDPDAHPRRLHGLSRHVSGHRLDRGAGAGLWQGVIALTVVFFPRTARLMRAVGLQVGGRQFVEAAVVVGGTQAHIVVHHILPNAFGPLIVQASYVLARAIVTEAGLSFLGLGLPPPTPSWGNMLGDARTFLQHAWWFATFPGLAIVLTVLSVNLLGDALRDNMDPRLRT